jgi:hypothetical protein
VAKENRGNNGAKHLLLQQSLGGRTVYGAYVKAAVDASGRLTSVIDASVDVTPVAAASINANGAKSAALAHRFGGNVPAFYRDPIVTPVVIPMDDDSLEEGFLVETWELRSNALWHTLVGRSGAIVHQELRTNNDSYFIFPIHPASRRRRSSPVPARATRSRRPDG